MDQFDRWINEDPHGGGTPVQTIDSILGYVFLAMVIVSIIIAIGNYIGPKR
jgi:hypothetical protein